MEPRQVTKQHGIEKGIRPIKPGNELSHIPWNIFEDFRRPPIALQQRHNFLVSDCIFYNYCGIPIFRTLVEIVSRIRKI